MELIVKNPNVPLRGWIQEDLDSFLSTTFKYWLSGLLNIKSENEEQVDNALIALKKQCLGMGLKEIKEMFEMYVDGKLDIEPISNYFDRVLLGKIVKSYRSYKNRISRKSHFDKVKEANESYKKQNIINAFNWYKERGQMHHRMSWMLSYLVFLNHIVINEKIQKKRIDRYLKTTNSEELSVTLANLSFLRDFFDNLIKQNKNIKEIF